MDILDTQNRLEYFNSVSFLATQYIPIFDFYTLLHQVKIEKSYTRLEEILSVKDPPVPQCALCTAAWQMFDWN